MRAHLPRATWIAAAMGRHQLEVNHLALELGGHCRTGLEDNVRWDRDVLAASNVPARGTCSRAVRRVQAPRGDPAQAREMLGLAG